MAIHLPSWRSLFLLILSLGLFYNGALSANTFIVNTDDNSICDADLADGICSDGNGKCSLPAAIQQANALGGGTIELAVAEITLSGSSCASGAPSSNIVLNGAGGVLTFTTYDSSWDVQSGAFRNLVVHGPFSLYVGNNSTVTGNQFDGIAGVSIYGSDSTFANNSITNSLYGLELAPGFDHAVARNQIKNNIISDNGVGMITNFDYLQITANNYSITGNVVANNQMDGIDVVGDNNILQNNTISGNRYSGIRVRGFGNLVGG